MRKKPDRIGFCYLDHKTSRLSVGLSGGTPLIETVIYYCTWIIYDYRMAQQRTPPFLLTKPYAAA